MKINSIRRKQRYNTVANLDLWREFLSKALNELTQLEERRPIYRVACLGKRTNSIQYNVSYWFGSVFFLLFSFFYFLSFAHGSSGCCFASTDTFREKSLPTTLQSQVKVVWLSWICSYYKWVKWLCKNPVWISELYTLRCQYGIRTGENINVDDIFNIRPWQERCDKQMTGATTFIHAISHYLITVI